MASVFGHGILAGSLGVTLPKVLRRPQVILLGILCSIMPDADVLGFNFGIPYGSIWGHRGMTHSILFGIGFGLLIAFLFHYSRKRKEQLILAAYYIVCTVSHGVLDGMTTGGKGVGYFSPFDTERYFLPWRMIQVSPMSISRFFNEWGIAVIKSELLWIGVPSLVFVLCVQGIRKLSSGK